MKNTFSFRLKNRFATALLTGLCLLWGSWTLRAQTTDNFPVQTTVFFGGPSSQRLSDWFTSDKRLFIHLRLKDLTKPTLAVYLRWQLDGPGLRIATREGYVPPAFFSLTPGSLTRLSGTDLAAQYFAPALLEAEGLDPQQAYNASLPEGFYTFSVQAFEAATGQVVSNTAQTFLVLSSPQPPILNLPANGTSVPVTALQKVPFQWTPRHFATPASQVVYRLKVCRVPDGEEPNEQTMLTCTEPVLDQTVPATSLTGDQTQWIQPLEAGGRYAAQVQAIDLADQLTNFANQGYSQVQWFRYGQECAPPASFTLQSLTSDRVRLRWEAQPQALAYVVEYKAETAADWTTVKVYAPTHTVTGLQNKTTYLFRLRSDCGGLLPSAPSEEQSWNISQEAPEAAPEWPKELLQPELISVQTLDTVAVPLTTLQELYVNFPTPTTDQTPSVTASPAAATAANVPITTKLKIPDCALRAGSFADCLPTHPVIPPPTGEELTSLSVGDVLGIYDFAVFVTKVGDGPELSGEGLVRLPFLGNAMAPVEFKGVKAKKEEGDANGGCVYEVDPTGLFQLKNDVEARELAERRQALIQALVQKSQPQAFVGTLQQALQKYDLTAKAITEAKQAGRPATPEQRQLITQYTAAILQGSGALKTQLDALGTENETVTTLLKDLKALTVELETNRVTIEKGTDVPVITDLEAKYLSLFERIKQLTATPAEPPVIPSNARITNVGIGNIDFQSAALSWMGGKTFAKYSILYAADGEGELTQTVTSPQLALKSLKPGRNYTYKIVGYSETGEVLDTYGPALFATPANTLPPPENLAYTVQADGSVRINWNKNSLHQRFKLTYKTASGEERTLYPTTNSATLTGLDLSRIYAYDVTAYGKDQRVSDLALGTLNELQPCDGFSIETPKVNANREVIFSTSGCLNAAGNETGQITWYYRTAQNALKSLVGNELKIDENGKDKDGERVVLAIIDHGIIAECKTSAQVCTSEWKALDECFWALFHTKSPEAIPSEDGLMTTIHSKLACYDFDGQGSIRWNNGMTGSSITVELNAVQDYTATCYMKNGTIPCASVTYSVKKQECTDFAVQADRTLINRKDNVLLTANSCFGSVTWSVDGSDAGIGNRLYVRPEKTTAYRALCKAGQISCMKEVTVTVAPASCSDFSVTASVTLLNAGELTTLTALNCKGIVDWGAAGKGPQVTVRPAATTTYTADCTYGNAACPPQTIQIQVRPESPFKVWANTYEVIGNEKTTIYTGGCGANTWADGYTLKAEKLSSEGYISTAAPKNLSAQAGTYAISCFSNQCSPVCQIGQTQIIEIKKRPECSDFRVGATQLSLPKGGTTVLMSIGCSGTVMWDNNLGSGPNLRVSPVSTTTYTAICSDNHCPKSITVSVTEAACQDFRLTVPQPDFPLSPTEKWIQPAVTGCQGNVIWKDGEGKTLSLQPYNGDRYYITRWDRTATYSVECAATGCKHSFTINAPVASPFSLTASPAQIAAGQSAVLTATGCDGTITWQQVTPLFFQNGNTVRPTQTTTYRATCQTTANKTSSSFVTVSVVADANCTFAANASPSLIGNDGSRSATLIASGCVGDVRWDQNAGSGAEVSVLPAQTTAYTATCTAAGTTCTTEVTVAVVPCDDFTIDIIDNSTLSAVGCTGEVLWESQNVKANTFVPTSTEAAVYTATCLSTGCQAFVFFAPPPAYLPCKAFVAKATPALVYARKSTSVTFEASGCEAGTVQWSNGKTGFSFTENLSLKEDLTYIAECIIDGEKVPTSVTVKILRNSSGEPLDPACSNFTAFAKPINSALSAPYPAGTEFVLTAQNCPGKVTWDPSLGQGNKVSPDMTSHYTATCYSASASQSVCASQKIKIEIQQDRCETFGSRTDKTVRSLTHLTNVVGINGQTCPGKVIWYSREERTQNSIICELSPANPAYALAEPLVYKGETVSYSYFYDCWVDANTVCKADINYIISNSGQIGGAGRVSAYNSSCLPASLPLAMTDYLAKLLCDSKPQWQGSAERAQAFYAALQQAIAADPTLGSYQPDFSKVDQNALLAALQAADCKAAGQELSKAFNGSISVDAFNENVRGGYSQLLQKTAQALKRFYITPSAKAFELPQGATPLFFKEVKYPQGTLHGFELADKRRFYAKLDGPGTNMYGYVSLLDNVTVFRNPMPPATGRQKAYLLFRYEENGVCGYRQYEDSYDFPVKTTNTVLPDLIQPATTPTVDKRFDACEQVTVVKIDGNSFRIKTTNGRVTVEGTWQTFGKCSTCPEAAEKALQTALQKARDRNGGSITESTLIVEGITKTYGSAGEITYQNMNLMDILKNLATTYNSLLDKAKVPEEVWLPGKEFFVRDSKGIIAGTLDGAVSEATDKAQLIGLGLTVVSDPETTWNTLVSFKKELDWTKAAGIAKTMAQGLVGYDAAEFEKGGSYRGHATGKVGGTVAFNMVTGGIVLSMLNQVPDLLELLAKVIKKLEDLNWSKADIDAFTLDFQKSEDLLNKFESSQIDPQGWKALSVHSTLRKNADILQKATSVLQKGHISQADLETIISVNKGLGARASAVADLLDDLDNFALYRNQSGFGAIISGLKADWYNGAGADGANWVIAALRKEGTGTFPATTTNFEVSKTIGSNTRRYDAIVDNAITINNMPKNRYFEFKSYSSVPPSNFSDQFINDLTNADITDLSQLRWYFDTAKNPPNFETNMKNAIDGLIIPLTTTQKFGFEDVIDFKTKIKTDFATIFILK